MLEDDGDRARPPRRGRRSPRGRAARPGTRRESGRAAPGRGMVGIAGIISPCPRLARARPPRHPSAHAEALARSRPALRPAGRRRRAAGACGRASPGPTSRGARAPRTGARSTALVKAGPPPGVLAYVDGVPAGWCAISPREGLRRLERSRVMAPVDDRPVWTVTCFFIGRGYRGPASRCGCCAPPRRSPPVTEAPARGPSHRPEGQADARHLPVDGHRRHLPTRGLPRGRAPLAHPPGDAQGGPGPARGAAG